jgi:hypothetical protein
MDPRGTERSQDLSDRRVNTVVTHSFRLVCRHTGSRPAASATQERGVTAASKS